MCPACLAAISMIVAGVISTGGAAAAMKAMARRKENGDASGDEAATEQVERTWLKEKEKQA